MISDLRNRRIVIGVTVARSLGLMRGLPERLVAEGWDVHVVAGPGPELAALASIGAQVHELRMARTPNPLSDAVALMRWVRILRNTRPDVVFVGTPKAGLLSMLGARLLAVPRRVYHLRGLRLETARGWRRKLLEVTERLALACATEVLSVSKSLRLRTVQLGLVDARKIIVLGEGSSNGVDTLRFAPGEPDKALQTALGVDPGLPVIGYVGRLTPDKGSVELVDASAMLARQGLQHQLLVVGEVEAGVAAHALRSLEELGTRVILTGRVQDTAPYFRLMTVFCLPTHREGFPNVVLEAASSGTCTVTTDATGAVDSVVDDVTGIVVPMMDSTALAGALRQLVDVPELRKRMAIAARRRAELSFERAEVQTRVVSFLRSPAR